MTDDYELIDFGEGRKLERFGGTVLDRPSPAADGIRRALPTAWSSAVGRFDRTSGEQGFWRWREPVGADWNFHLNGVRLALAPTRFGHVGMFPEQIPNWQRLQQIARTAQQAGRPLTLLNLFAYTGGSSLAVATEKNEVVHVDASRSAVRRARENADLSDKGGCRIRWIVDDARDYCRRELKRGRVYDGVILDPPSYGHGPRGKAWSIDEHLPGLLQDCGRLLFGSSGAASDSDGERFLLLSCHAPMIDVERAREMIARAIPELRHGRERSSRNRLRDRADRSLDCGLSSFWTFGDRGEVDSPEPEESSSER